MDIDLKKVKGILFDMDGVLVDSEPAMARAAVEGMAEYGIHAAAEDFTPYLGTDEMTYFGCVVKMHGGTYTEALGERIYDIYWPDGAGPYHFICRRRGYGGTHPRDGLSNGNRVERQTGGKLDVNITASRIPRDALDSIVSGSDVVKRKPIPEIFLTAAARLGLPPAACIVAEDAISGIKAAKAAGMLCFGVTTTFSAETLLETGADFTGSGISELVPYLEKQRKGG